MTERVTEVPGNFPEFTDSNIEAIYRDARDLQAMMNRGQIDPSEVSPLLDDLDARWPLMERSVTVSGRVTRYFRDPESSDDGRVMFGERTEVTVEDEPMVSLGFMLSPVSVAIDGEEIGKEWRVGHYFRMSQEPMHHDALLKQYYEYRGFAPIDMVAVDTPMKSPEVALKIAGYFYPDTMEEIDHRVCNTLWASDAVLSLRGLKIKPHKDDVENGTMVISDYLDSLVKFDTHVPYVVEAKGLFQMYDEEAGEWKFVVLDGGSRLVAQPEFFLIHPKQRIKEGQVVESSDKQVVALQMRASFTADEESAQLLIMPVDRIKGMMALRDIATSLSSIPKYSQDVY